MATTTSKSTITSAQIQACIVAHSTKTKTGGQLIATGSYKPEAKSYINSTASNATSWAMVQALLAAGPCTMGTLQKVLALSYGHACFIGYNVKRSKLAKVPYKKGVVQITEAQIASVLAQFGITIPYSNEAK